MAEKTNAVRFLTAKKIPFKEHLYLSTGAISGQEVAEALGENPDTVFKTLVTTGKSGAHYVFIVPVSGELNLKKAASAVGEKSVEMLKSKDLLPLTGYVHGGCSPVGMKKLFTTVADKSAENLPAVFCSGGKIGFQIEIAPGDLQSVVPFTYADLI